MKNVFFILLVTGLFFTCKDSTTVQSVRSKPILQGTKDEAKIIVQKLLDLPRLQSFYHKEVADRLPIKLLENEYVKVGWNLIKFNQKVQISDQTFFEDKGINDYLILDSLHKKSDTTYFRMLYHIEGISINIGHLYRVVL